jgi:hypothetical protein
MGTIQMHIETAARRSLAWVVAPAVIALLVVGVARSSAAGTVEPKTFSSAHEASQALFQAVQNHDEQAIEAILGTKDVTSSGDGEQDKLEREQFSQKYQEMHRLVQEPDGSTVLYIGAENWPFPIPLSSTKGGWHFDSALGATEILFRRIGENEAMAIEVCRVVISSHTDPAPTDGRDDPVREYAERIRKVRTVSTDGDARSEPDDAQFGGYYFRAVGEPSGTSLTKSPAARGAKTAGLAFVAYPAEYRSSGVMTFAVTRNGVVYERDLGPETPTLARAMNELGPASRWKVVK